MKNRIKAIIRYPSYDVGVFDFSGNVFTSTLGFTHSRKVIKLSSWTVTYKATPMEISHTSDVIGAVVRHGTPYDAHKLTCSLITPQDKSSALVYLFLHVRQFAGSEPFEIIARHCTYTSSRELNAIDIVNDISEFCVMKSYLKVANESTELEYCNSTGQSKALIFHIQNLIDEVTNYLTYEDVRVINKDILFNLYSLSGGDLMQYVSERAEAIDKNNKSFTYYLKSTKDS